MYIKVHVVPNSKREYMEQISPDLFTVYTKEPPIQNKANESVFRIVKNFFSSSKRVILIKGQHKGHKLFEILEE